MKRVFVVFGVMTVASLKAESASAQSLPWVQFQDFSSERICGLIRAADRLELVVLAQTGALRRVSGTDITLSDFAVDISTGDVAYLGEPGGRIEFVEDADGNRALFWVTITGSLVALDPFTGAPGTSDESPVDVDNAGCDPCPQWDDSSVCGTDGNENANDNDGSGGGGLPPLSGLCGGGAASTAILLLLGLCFRKSL